MTTLSLGGIPRTRSRTVDVTRPYQDTQLRDQLLTFRTGETTRDETRYGAGKWNNPTDRIRRDEAFVDVGGPFYNEKLSYWDDGRIYTASYPPFYSYRGVQLPVGATLVTRLSGTDTYWNPVVSASDDQSLFAWGGTAISRCAPTNPHSQVLTALGELYRDGLPSAVGVKTLRDRDVGGEFLNYQFGIAPLLSDIRKLHKSLTESQKILNQYLRDSGRMVRRRYDQPESIETSVTTKTGFAGLGTPILVTYLYRGSDTSGATRVSTTTIKSKRWFKGAFTYYAQLPTGRLASIERRLQEYNHLLGILPTPAVLWNLTPWSWAADWVFNIGDVLNNVSMMQSDGLVLLYGYVMEHKTITREHHCFGYSLSNGDNVNSVNRFTSEVKTRRKATPFGFGLKLEEFTPRQWAILTALGLSRGQSLAR